MKIITFDNIKSLNIAPEKCYEWVEEMLERKNDSVLPPKIHMDMQGSIFCNVMPCMINNKSGKHWGGVKVVTRYPKRVPSLDSKIMLFDSDTGAFVSLMDGNWITAMRTGAVAAHSIMLFAKPKFGTIGMIGLGNVARASIKVLASKLADRELTVKLFRYKDQASRFIEEFKHYKNLRFVIVDGIEECIRNTDVVISCATYFANDIAKDEWFDEGVLVVPVHTRGFSNCDLFFDKVYADDTSHVNNFKYFSRFKSFAEVSDVMKGEKQGRVSEKERILVYNIGISIHDINYASHIYEMICSDRSLYDNLNDTNLGDPIDKFWL